MFENDIEKMSKEDLAALEDCRDDRRQNTDVSFVFPKDLYKLRLEYSCEGIYATPCEGVKVSVGEHVIIPTRYGKDLALVLGKAENPVGIRESDIIEISRLATEEDLKKASDFKVKEAEAFRLFREKVEYHRLDMKLIATHYLLEEPKILFFFSSENRVDFRELVKDLVSVFKMRIELRQIGVRDESRITGGIGVCGRAFCCHSVSDKLRPVSIRMAKDQNLSLNSMKISGQCGRLLCCLAYEYEWYADSRKKLPHEGLRLRYDNTNFKITDVNPITEMIKMLGEDGRMLEVAASRFKKSEGRWRISK